MSDSPASLARSMSTSLVILAALFAFGAFRYDHFGSLATVTGLLNDYAYVGIAAVGVTLVIIAGGIDLSAGAVVACSSILIAKLVQAGWHPLPAMGVAVVGGFCFGAAMGSLIHSFELPPFLVTLAGMFAVRACGFMIHPQSLGIQHPFLPRLRAMELPLGTANQIGPFANSFLLVLLIAWLFSTRTPAGRAVLAVGGNAKSAAYMGLPVARTRILVYSIAGLCSALAGCVLTLYREAGDPTSTVGLELDVIAAAVLGGAALSGGVGSVFGTLVGVCILGLIQLIITFEGTLDAAWTSIVTGCLLFVFLGLQRGLNAAGLAFGHSPSRRIDKR